VWKKSELQITNFIRKKGSPGIIPDYSIDWKSGREIPVSPEKPG
jgi:hypothetical protein